MTRTTIGKRLTRIAAFITALGLLSAAPASATTYETLDLFSGAAGLPEKPNVFPEEVQLGGVGGMAINLSGAGGVAPGTIYTAGYGGGFSWHAARFSPEGEFELAWNSERRCGPKAEEPVYPTCPAIFGEPSGKVDIDIDQSTGNVYVFSGDESIGVIREYSPDASKLITQFAEKAASGETTAASPAKYHGTYGVGNIAVDAAGAVYLFDVNFGDKFFHRLMVFKPQTPGDYEHYVYAGQSQDLLAGFEQETKYPGNPVLDSAGNLYVAGEEFIAKLNPSQPAAPPLCEFKLAIGGITSITVNPVGGEVFYYTYKNRKIHELSPCDSEGKFTETGAFAPGPPKRDHIEAMAFNPTRQFDLSRPPGVLYAADPTGEGGKSEPYPSGGFLLESALGFILGPPQENPPKVESETVSHIGAMSATLEAQINPKGAQTSYFFQYLSEAAYEGNEPSDRFAGATEAPLGGAVLGSGQAALSAAVVLSGLEPDSAYRYRVIATSHCAPGNPSKVCEAIGVDRAFRTFAVEAPVLPDDRAWELVSPAQKNGGEVLPAAPNVASCGAECKPGLAAARYPALSSPDGDSVAYQGSPFVPNEGASEFDEYVSRRTASGWQTNSLSPPLAGDAGAAGFAAFGVDSALSAAVIFAVNPSLTPEAPAGYRNLFSQPADDRFGLEPLLKSEPPNRPASGTTGFVVTYAGASADLSRIFFEANDALTEETPFAPEAVDGGATKYNLYEWSEGQLRLVNVQPGNAETIPGAAFGSGFQLATTIPPAADFSHAISSDGSRVFWSSPSGQVYLRENGESTVEIPDHGGKFLSASADGSKVLLNDGVVYDIQSEAGTDLTEGKGGFQGLVGQSDDLSSLYFIDTEVLDETANQQGDTAEAAEPNLYAWNEDSLSYVATLLPGDNPGLGVWAAAPVRRSAEASPDGRWLAFNSKAELTGIDAIGPCDFDSNQQQYVGSVPCEEVFLYDSDAGKLSCASCNPVGEHPHGGSFLRTAKNAPGSLAQPRYLSNSGRLFFDSRDALSVLDSNGNVEDVYEYEPEGIGSCAKQGGCVFLVSAGREAIDSNLLAADPSGKNVFFTTRDQLALKDKDDAIDLYVAREGGGIPSETEVARGECQGEACQPQISAPNDPTPASSAFEGSGNVDEQKAKKKKAHRKKHKKKHKAKAKRAHKRANDNRGGSK